jgi:hypothetical protein
LSNPPSVLTPVACAVATSLLTTTIAHSVSGLGFPPPL